MPKTHSHLTRTVPRLVALALALAVAAVAWFASPANATTVTGRGVGFLSSAGGGIWLGSWQLDDGRLAFCVNTDRSTPNGGSHRPHDGTGWYSPDDRAKLAYISREWASTSDPVTAAAGQIATWSITGLGRYTVDEYAAMTGAEAERVRTLASQMIDEAATEASRGVNAHLELVTTDGVGTSVRADLVVDSLSRGSVPVPPSTHAGVVTLTGATFSDGSTTKRIMNGVSHPVVQDGSDAVMSATAAVTFDALPYGDHLSMGESTTGAQNLLIATPATASASATIERTVPSELPFQPIVTTQTSHPEAAPGASVHDILTVDVATGPGLSDTWGVYGPEGGPFTPVPVTVRSSLLGPFDEPIVEADAPPADAPVVCEVSVMITTGPGEYVTPECVLPAAGYYVWIERIDAADTASEHGAAKILPWTSRFGVASEITFAPQPERPAAQPPAEAAPRLPETGAVAAPIAMTALTMSLAVTVLGAAMVWYRAARRRADQTG